MANNGYLWATREDNQDRKRLMLKETLAFSVMF